MPKPKEPKIDGLSPGDIKNIRSAIRKVWQWSHPRKLCLKRCTENGWSVCESCHRVTPKIFVDHKVPVGDVDGGFIERLFCPSSGLQGYCKTCHDDKTKGERNEKRRNRATVPIRKGRKTS